MTSSARVLDAAARADRDPSRLTHLTEAERPAYIAGRSERAWRRVACFAAGLALGGWLILLAGCGGGGGDDADGRPDQTIGRPDCAASGVCT